MKRILLGVCCVLTLLSSCVNQQKKIVLQGLAQGSYYAITYFDELDRNFQHEIDSIFHAVDMSVNLWVDSSVISKVNRNEEVTLDSIFIDNFRIAQKAAHLSDGYFDPTISPIVAAWGFSYKSGDNLTPQLIDSLRSLVDYRKIRIENGMVVKENPNMKLDFNAIAQGYTSDLIAAFLESRGIKNYLVDTGGESWLMATSLTESHGLWVSKNLPKTGIRNKWCKPASPCMTKGWSLPEVQENIRNATEDDIPTASTQRQAIL